MKIDLNDYYYYVHVIDKKGFTSAANVLNIPKSKLSRHVAQLERRLDTQLIQRTSRQFKITETGQVFYRHAKALIEEMEIAESAMQKLKGELCGQVTLSCSIGVAQFVIKDLLVDFMQKYPNVELIQQVTNQSIDMVASGVDMAIRGHMEQLPDSSLIQKHLAEVSWHLFASPEYLEREEPIRTTNDLSKQKGLKLGWQPSLGHWNLQNNNGVKDTIPFNPLLCSDDISTLKQAVIDGMAIVSLPSYICKDELASGKLVRVLPDWTSGTAQLSLLTPSRRGQSPATHALSDYLVKNLGRFVDGFNKL